MNKRIIALLLAILMAAPAILSGCAESNEDTGETSDTASVSADDTTAAEETEMTRANTPDDLPSDLNFEGATATIAARTKAWFTGEMYVEELNGKLSTTLYMTATSTSKTA